MPTVVKGRVLESAIGFEHLVSETITTTPTHPFYVPKKGWTEAAKLRAGDILVTCNGEYVVVELVQHELLETPITVYNFEVEDFHTYYVAADADAEFVLVHNRCGDSNGRGVGGKGWENDKVWKGNVKTVSNGGTIKELNGGIPTRVQGEKLITQAGGRVIRIEGPHAYPNPHTFPHINYVVRGIKGTLRILKD